MRNSLLLLLLIPWIAQAEVTASVMQDVKLKLQEASGQTFPIFQILDDDYPNARANINSRQIQVNRGMLLLAETPDELAGVIAHEMCHIINNSPNEYDADTCGKELGLKAGYSKHGMAKMYRKLAETQNWSEDNGAHPPWSQRVKFWEK